MLVQQSIIKTLTGNIDQLSTTGIFTHHFVIKAQGSNTDNVFIGHSNSSNVLPTTLDATTKIYELAPSESVEITIDPLSLAKGENYILSHWVAKGTVSDKIDITYVQRRTSANPT